METEDYVAMLNAFQQWMDQRKAANGGRTLGKRKRGHREKVVKALYKKCKESGFDPNLTISEFRKHFSGLIEHVTTALEDKEVNAETVREAMSVNTHHTADSLESYEAVQQGEVEDEERNEPVPMEEEALETVPPFDEEEAEQQEEQEEQTESPAAEIMDANPQLPEVEGTADEVLGPNPSDQPMDEDMHVEEEQQREPVNSGPDLHALLMQYLKELSSPDITIKQAQDIMERADMDFRHYAPSASPKDNMRLAAIKQKGVRIISKLQIDEIIDTDARPFVEEYMDETTDLPAPAPSPADLASIKDMEEAASVIKEYMDASPQASESLSIRSLSDQLDSMEDVTESTSNDLTKLRNSYIRDAKKIANSKWPRKRIEEALKDLHLKYYLLCSNNARLKKYLDQFPYETLVDTVDKNEAKRSKTPEAFESFLYNARSRLTQHAHLNANVKEVDARNKALLTSLGFLLANMSKFVLDEHKACPLPISARAKHPALVAAREQYLASLESFKSHMKALKDRLKDISADPDPLFTAGVLRDSLPQIFESFSELHEDVLDKRTDAENVLNQHISNVEFFEGMMEEVEPLHMDVRDAELYGYGNDFRSLRAKNAHLINEARAISALVSKFNHSEITDANVHDIEALRSEIVMRQTNYRYQFKVYGAQHIDFQQNIKLAVQKRADALKKLEGEIMNETGLQYGGEEYDIDESITKQIDKLIEKYTADESLSAKDLDTIAQQMREIHQHILYDQEELLRNPQAMERLQREYDRLRQLKYDIESAVEYVRDERKYDAQESAKKHSELLAQMKQDLETLEEYVKTDLTAAGPAFAMILSKLNDQVSTFGEALTEEEMDVMDQIERMRAEFSSHEEAQFKSIRPLAQNEQMKSFLMEPFTSHEEGGKRGAKMLNDKSLNFHDTYRLLVLSRRILDQRAAIIAQMNANRKGGVLYDPTFDMVVTHLLPVSSIDLKLRFLRELAPVDRQKYKDGMFVKAVAKLLEGDEESTQLLKDFLNNPAEVELDFVSLKTTVMDKLGAYLDPKLQEAGLDKAQIIGQFETMQRELLAISESILQPQLTLQPDPEYGDKQQNAPHPVDTDSFLVQGPITREQIDEQKRQSFNQVAPPYWTAFDGGSEDTDYIPLHIPASRFYFSSDNFKSLSDKFDSHRPLQPKEVIKYPDFEIRQILAEYGKVFQIKKPATREKDLPALRMKEVLELRELKAAYKAYTAGCLPQYPSVPDTSSSENPPAPVVDPAPAAEIVGADEINPNTLQLQRRPDAASNENRADTLFNAFADPTYSGYSTNNNMWQFS